MIKFSCEKALLQAAISTTSRAVSVKSSIPALEGILLEAGDQLRLTGYNLETGIRTTIVLMAVMNLGNILNAGFDQVYNLYSASVYATGDILDTYVYRVGLQGLQYSFGTAVGLLKSVIAFVLMIGANKLAQKYTDSKIF